VGLAWPDMVVCTVVFWKVQRIAEEVWSIKFQISSCADEKMRLLLCGKQKRGGVTNMCQPSILQSNVNVKSVSLFSSAVSARWFLLNLLGWFEIIGIFSYLKTGL
jgi:hypothetical protein